jgi:hypothetical protein
VPQATQADAMQSRLAQQFCQAVGVEGGGVAANKVRLVRSIFAHDFDQLIPDLGLVVDYEQLHHCGGAVKGGGKRLSRRVGSARIACS